MPMMMHGQPVAGRAAEAWYRKKEERNARRRKARRLARAQGKKGR